MEHGGRKIVFIFLAFTLFFTSVSSKTEEVSNETLEKWKDLDRQLKSGVQSVIKQLMPMMMESSERVNITSQCTKDLFYLITGLRSLKKWAFSFVDSSSKMIDGMLRNTASNFGVYDQCLDTEVPNSRKEDELLFQGQYCRVDIYFPLPKKTKIYRGYDRLEELRNFTGSEVLKYFSTLGHFLYYHPIRLGVCIPSSCTENDFAQILNVATEKFHLEPRVRSCEIKKEKIDFNGIQVFAIFCTCTLVALVLFGTAIEKFSDGESENFLSRFLRCFSAINNFKKLTSTKTNSKELRCLNGIKFLSITWVILGHGYFYTGWFVEYYNEMMRTQELVRGAFAQTVVNASMVVDTFFFVSGLLVCYMCVQHVILNKKKFNLVSFVIHRLWRIVPVYYFVVLFVFLIPLMGSGPVFQETLENDITHCYDTWWRNLLFINNFFGFERNCLMHSWYVACDIQLYLASLLVLLPMFKSQKLGVAINIFIILFSVTYAAYAVGVLNYPFTIAHFYIDPNDRSNLNKYVYANSLTRAGPYFTGVLVGYILATKPNLKIPKVFQLIGWCLAILSSSLVLYATAIWYHVRIPSKGEVLLYASLYHVAFVAGVGWMTFCCVTGRGGFINSFLSWKAWVPLSKLTFSMYLTQPIFQTVYISVFRYTQEYTHLMHTVNSLGYICISGMLALLLSLLIESPFLALEKAFFNKPRSTEKISDEKDIKLSIQSKTLENGNGYKSYQIEHNMDNHAFDGKD